jgi:hypothetical protein
LDASTGRAEERLIRDQTLIITIAVNMVSGRQDRLS